MNKLLSWFLIGFFYYSNSFAQAPIELRPFATGLQVPVDIAHAGDDRLFIVQQNGVIVILEEDGSLLNQPFLNISDRITFGGERGLLGLAFHPNFANNRLFYVNYTDRFGDTKISVFTANEDLQTADADSERIILTVEQTFGNHNGGGLKFGTDGFLYIGLGDGGSAGDPLNSAQDPQSLLGKMLRISVDGTENYTIPPDNPFVGNPAVRDEIWTIGLRNPWRYSFDRLTGDLWIGDVGQAAFEEVTLIRADDPPGLNAGWRCYEGDASFNQDDCDETNQFLFPIFTYPTSAAVGQSITGGFVYRGRESPDLVGKYIYGDFVTGTIWALTVEEDGTVNNETILELGFTELSTFGENASGELFVAAYATGRILQITQRITTSLEPVNPIIQQFELAPNPFTSTFQLTYTTERKTTVQCSVVNQIGQVVKAFNREVEGATTEILDLSNQPEGVYFIQLKIDNQLFTKKLIKI